MGALRFLGRGVILRCPSCGRGRLYSSLFVARKECAECGHPFERDRGDWTGGVEMTVVLSCMLSLGVFVWLWSFTTIDIWILLGIVMGLTVLVVPFFYRHVKGFWIGMVRAWEGPDPQPSPYRDPQWFTDFWDREQRR